MTVNKNAQLEASVRFDGGKSGLEVMDVQGLAKRDSYSLWIPDGQFNRKNG